MKQILLKQAPIRLEQLDYQNLREQVLRRDGWRCQLCGSMSNLEVHHKELRSQSGEDSEQNLITLCVACHSLAHGGSKWKRWNEAKRDQKTR
jgi:5-methylcytosine-specific restriction endonuclease McrA